MVSFVKQPASSFLRANAPSGAPGPTGALASLVPAAKRISPAGWWRVLLSINFFAFSGIFAAVGADAMSLIGSNQPVVGWQTGASPARLDASHIWPAVCSALKLSCPPGLGSTGAAHPDGLMEGCPALRLRRAVGRWGFTSV